MQNKLSKHVNMSKLSLSLSLSLSPLELTHRFGNFRPWLPTLLDQIGDVHLVGDTSKSDALKSFAANHPDLGAFTGQHEESFCMV